VVNFERLFVSVETQRSFKRGQKQKTERVFSGEVMKGREKRGEKLRTQKNVLNDITRRKAVSLEYLDRVKEKNVETQKKSGAKGVLTENGTDPKCKKKRIREKEVSPRGGKGKEGQSTRGGEAFSDRKKGRDVKKRKGRGVPKS